MEEISKAEAISLARKCYYRFCEEFLTALKNIEGIKTAMAWQYIDDPRECSMVMREANCYKEVWERAKKEVGLNEPHPEYMDIRKKEENVKKEIDRFLDDVFPRNEYMGRRQEYEKIERRKGHVAEFLQSQFMKWFDDGYATRAVEEKVIKN